MGKDKFYNSLAFYYDFICSSREKDVENLLQLIARHKSTKGRKLLDIGCGTGLEDEHLKAHFHVRGLDFNKGVLEIAKKRNPDIPYTKGDMRTFKINDRFDIITCFDAMSHLQNYNDWKKALKNFYGHLEKGGLLIFYIDGMFLKEHNREKETINVTSQERGNLNVILFETYHKRDNKIENNMVFLIRKPGKTTIKKISLAVSPVFEIKKILAILRELGFEAHLYEHDPAITFSTREYSKASKFPIFVCVKK